MKREALEFAREHPTSHLATVENGKPYVRVMHSPRIDDDFTVWYATSASSNKVRHIRANPQVCAVFHHEGKWVRVMGKAEIVTDLEEKGRLWEDDWARYWPDGKGDPDYILISIKAESVDYLDLTKGAAGEQKVI